MITIMTSHVTSAGIGGGIELPSGLTVTSYSDHRSIKIDQAVLFTAVCIVAGVTGAKTMESVQILARAGLETRGCRRVRPC
jgi:hypothetical protein